MFKRQTVILLSVTVLAVAACAAGRDFVRPPTESLILGKTTYKEIFSEFGTPYREGTTLLNGQSVKQVSYSYASGRGTPAVDGVTPGRTMGFHFMDDVLVGYEFVSSFKGDQTDFDESKVKEIKIGKTTREEVIKLLGPAGGLRQFPLLKEPDHIGLTYFYSQTKSAGFSFKIYQKFLVVSVDSNNIVTDVVFTESGQR